jgi:cell division protein FtsB
LPGHGAAVIDVMRHLGRTPLHFARVFGLVWLLERELNRSFTRIGEFASMVIRRRLRAVLFPLALYCVSGSIGGYFVWHAVNGERGLKTKEDYERKITSLQKDLRDLQNERRTWEARIDLLHGVTIDQDLLDEEVRKQLGRVHKNDLVVILAPDPQKP